MFKCKIGFSSKTLHRLHSGRLLPLGVSLLPWIFPQVPPFVAGFVPGLEVLVASGRDTANNPPAFLFAEVLHLLTLILPHPSSSLWNSCLELPYQVSHPPRFRVWVQLGRRLAPRVGCPGSCVPPGPDGLCPQTEAAVTKPH